MKETLFTVESRFRIRGRGVVLLPGVSIGQYGSVKIGDPLVIRRPDGSVLHATVRGVEWSVKWVGEPPANPHYGVLVDVDDVPVGSVVTMQRRPE